MELQGKRIAILVAEQYEDLEVWYPALRLREAGAEVAIVGTGAESYTSRHGLPIQVDSTAEQVQPDDFDAMIIPSGPTAEIFADNPAMTALVLTAIQQGKLVATTASAGRMMVATRQGNERARRFFEMQEDVVRAEGPLEDSAVLREGNLIIARTPVDLLAFCRMIMAALAQPPASPTTPVTTG
jgi:protease I